MTIDILLTLLNAILGLVIAGIGVEMVNNPPDTPAKKNVYRVVFAICGLGIVAIVFLQAVRADKDHTEARRESAVATQRMHDDQILSQTKLSYMQGTVDSIAKFTQQLVEHPPASQASKFDPSWALAIIKMAQNAQQLSSGYGAAYGTGGYGGSPSALGQQPPSAQERPTISSVPAIFHDGQISGNGFGTTPRLLYYHIRAKSWGEDLSPDSLFGGMNNSNYRLVPAKAIRVWTDRSIQLAYPDGYWDELMRQIESFRKSQNARVPSRSEVEIGYLVKMSEEDTGGQYIYAK